MLCLPTSAHVHDVLFGQEGLAKTLAPGTIVIDQTTGDPSQTRVMATELERHGCALIDAPISNDALNASAGAPTIMCGGPMAAFEEVRPVLESISLTIVYCGASGNGHLAALVDNTIALCNGLITYECAAMAVKYGLKAETVSSVINKSGGWSGASERILPALAMGDQTTNFRLELAAKDIRLSTQLGIQFGAPMVVANVVRSVIETALNQLGEQANMDGMSKVFEAMAAIKFARI
jgi:3-hydroxyisobutyrate dehydrogenase